MTESHDVVLEVCGVRADTDIAASLSARRMCKSLSSEIEHGDESGLSLRAPFLSMFMHEEIAMELE